MQQMVALKMIKLGIDYEKLENDEGLKTYSFVLINPSPDFILQTGDIVYLLKPGHFTKLKDSKSDLESKVEMKDEQFLTVNESIKTSKSENKKTTNNQSNVTFI